MKAGGNTSTFALVFYSHNSQFEILDVASDTLGTSVNGIWVFNRDELESMKSLVNSKFVIGINEKALEYFSISPIYQANQLLEIAGSANREAASSIKLFHRFLDENPKSKLKLPNFFDWNSINSNLTIKENSLALGKTFFNINQKNENSELIGTSKFLRYLLDNWLADERVRVSRKGIFEQSEPRFIPPIKMQEFHEK